MNYNQFSNLSCYEEFEIQCDLTGISKIDILNFEISTISKMRDMAYIMGEEQLPQISITTIGGKEPILIRSIHPNYALITEENEYCNEVIIENNNTLELPLNYPFIIDKNYQATTLLSDKEKYKRIDSLINNACNNPKMKNSKKGAGRFEDFDIDEFLHH